EASPRKADRGRSQVNRHVRASAPPLVAGRGIRAHAGRPAQGGVERLISQYIPHDSGATSNLFLDELIPRPQRTRSKRCPIVPPRYRVKTAKYSAMNANRMNAGPPFRLNPSSVKLPVR